MRIEIEQAINTHLTYPDPYDNSVREVSVLFGEIVIFEMIVDENSVFNYYDDDDIRKEALTRVGEKLKYLLGVAP